MPLCSIPGAADVISLDKLWGPSWSDVERKVKQQVRNLAVSPLLSHTLAVMSSTVGPDQLHMGHTATVVRRSRSDANFDVVLERVESLVNEAEDEESGVVPPTEYALSETRRLLRSTRAKMDGTFPRAAVSTDDTGGISIYWIKQGRSVQLTIPASSDRPSYLYHREPTASDLQKVVTADSLAHRLEWFTAE